jgi:hypothetical protein
MYIYVFAKTLEDMNETACRNFEGYEAKLFSIEPGLRQQVMSDYDSRMSKDWEHAWGSIKGLACRRTHTPATRSDSGKASSFQFEASAMHRLSRLGRLSLDLMVNEVPRRVPNVQTFTLQREKRAHATLLGVHDFLRCERDETRA